MMKVRSMKLVRPGKGRPASSSRSTGKPQPRETFRDFIRTLEKLDRGATRSREGGSGAGEGGR